MSTSRRKTRTCKVGKLKIGSDHPIAIQTMVTGQAKTTKAIIEEIKSVEGKGCDLIRIAIPNLEAAKAIPEIKEKISLPLVADIHFDPRLAVAALDYGADKIRINPGNFNDKSYLDKVIALAKTKKAAIRIGVNAGSLEKDLWDKYEGPVPDALVESALRWSSYLENKNFGNFIVALKSSRVPQMIDSYERFACQTDIPLHLGVTEAGPTLPGAVKSAIGIGTLLRKGIGDTIRVSILDTVEKEVEICRQILKSLGLYTKEPDIIACPTCARTEIDLPSLVEKVEKALSRVHKPITVSVMGCVVNGIGEAREADFAIAGGKNCGVLYYKGEIYKAKVTEDRLIPELLNLIQKKT
ncbi:flavodoxin-dependent (E)-4-hydroxy-3-methylbut-2-enyl-diphosphate synthase [Patescibacteria group bacterium]|nr:flavodoxin-dependent (E)-4-hydroxy-3-methylbut-2-enyl-diphosphate synthase [Patescibacteria group bacterium]